MPPAGWGMWYCASTGRVTSSFKQSSASTLTMTGDSRTEWNNSPMANNNFARNISTTLVLKYYFKNDHMKPNNHVGDESVLVVMVGCKLRVLTNGIVFSGIEGKYSTVIVWLPFASWFTNNVQLCHFWMRFNMNYHRILLIQERFCSVSITENDGLKFKSSECLTTNRINLPYSPIVKSWK